MDYSELWKNQNYNIQIPYIVSVYITEYDLSKANINALYSEKYIDKNLYDYLYNSDKSVREVYIGNMIKQDENVYKVIQKGITEAKRLLFEYNNLQDRDIFSIRNDAVFVIGNKSLISEFGNYKFNKKNVYKICLNTSSKLQIYYNYDAINEVDTIDIKGISDDKLKLHLGYMLDFICKIFYGILSMPIETVINEFNDFYNKFINRQLPAGYYRDFDQYSQYKIITNRLFSYSLSSISDKEKNNIDINCNILLLRDIYFMLSDIYNNKVR